MIRQPNEIIEKEKRSVFSLPVIPVSENLPWRCLRLIRCIDVDFGIDRIEPRYRKPFIQPQSYEEILEDLTPNNVKDFDTLVFDTGGKLINLMSLWAIRRIRSTASVTVLFLSKVTALSAKVCQADGLLLL